MVQQLKEANIKVNAIKALYIATRTGQIPTRAELMMKNITNEFWEGYKGALNHKELWNMSIRGKTGSSKSTVAFLIMHKGTQHLMKLHRIKPLTGKEYQNYLFTRINSDQTEFIRFAMNQKTETISMIDEFSTMGETGFNSTTEQAMYSEHSDLFAQERVHKISCSPSHINDKNADIILDFLGRDDEQKVTQMMLNYKDATDFLIYPLGVVNFYVGDVMEMEAYKRYRIKKFKRLGLLKEHGIRNVKELEFAKITMEVVNRLYKLAKIEKQQDEDILSIVDTVRRENKMQYSIITLNYVVLRVKSILNNITKIQRLQKKIEKAKSKEEQDLLIEGLKEYERSLQEKISEEQEKIAIEADYRNIE